MIALALAPLCTPLPPEPTLLDAWRTSPGWLVVLTCAIVFVGVVMWHEFRWMRRAGDRGALTKWSVELAALAYSSGIAAAVVVFGILLPLSDAQSIWVNHVPRAIDNCQATVAQFAAAVQRQGQYGKGLLAVMFVLLLSTYWGIILSRRFIRRAHYSKMERGLERQ